MHHDSRTTWHRVMFSLRTLLLTAALAVIGLIQFVAIERQCIEDRLEIVRLALSSNDSSMIMRQYEKQSIYCPAPENVLTLTPWLAIGGCGGGGSGGGAGDGIRWIGNGATGGLFDLEVLTRYGFGQNYTNASISPRISFKPHWSTTVSISAPFMSKSGEVQPRSNQPVETRITGGIGDLTVDVSRAFGGSGEWSASLGMTVPTGQYDIKRGSDAAPEFLPMSLQKGSGLYNGSLMLNYTKDIEDGMLLFNAAFSYPFVVRPFSRKNEFLDTYFSAYRDSSCSRRFYYRGKPYGENDLGGFTPPSLSAGASYAYRGHLHYVHSLSLQFSAPLGVAWIPSEKVNVYAPRPDPDHKAWSAAIAYGLEFSRPEFPFYIAVSLPIHDKTNTPLSDEFDPAPFGEWDGPDFSDFLQQGTIAIGIKSTLF